MVYFDIDVFSNFSDEFCILVFKGYCIHSFADITSIKASRCKKKKKQG